MSATVQIPGSDDDQPLWMRSRQGDVGAFMELYARFANGVAAWLVRKGFSESTAEDAAYGFMLWEWSSCQGKPLPARTFLHYFRLKAWSRAHSIQFRRKRPLLESELRRESGGEQAWTLFDTLPATGAMPWQVLANSVSDLKHAIASALPALPERDREHILLSHTLESSDEICRYWLTNYNESFSEDGERHRWSRLRKRVKRVYGFDLPDDRFGRER